MAAQTYDFDYFRTRKQHIDEALSFVGESERLYEEYGREEDSRLQKLEAIRDGLNDSDLRIVVIGEFSRGKSSLLNALLGERILPTAKQQTTAINTFIFGVEDGGEPFIRIVYQDEERGTEELEWSSEALERWGTELVKEHRDARKEVERIELYSDHSLLKNEVVFIDTPGLEGIIEIHEDIAREAMNQAHVALWIQSAGQLGGTDREWRFLRETIAKNFNKFITVINKWDEVLAPNDAREQAKPRIQREQEALDVVRENFREEVGNVLTPEKLQTVIDHQNLLGVSALWALSDDAQRQSDSNVNDLARRIEQMCRNGEAEQELLASPLKKLSEFQQEFLGRINSEIEELEAEEDLESRRQKREKLATEIRTLESKYELAVQTSEQEHTFWSRKFCSRVEEQLISPLKDLRADVGPHLTESYVRRQLESGADSIGLPRELQQAFEQRMEDVESAWGSLREDMESSLSELRAEFSAEMKGAAAGLNERLGGVDIEIPALEMETSADLSAFEEYQKKKSDLAANEQELQDQIDELEQETRVAESQKSTLDQRMQEEKRRLNRLRKRRESMGGPPSPTTEVRTVKESREGILGWVAEKLVGRKEVQRTVKDTSNIDRYRQRVSEVESRISQQSDEIEAIRDEVESKTGMRITKEQARRKYERKLEKLREELARSEHKAQEQFEKTVTDVLENLRRSTVKRIDAQITSLESTIESSIRDIFDSQLDEMKAQVESQYLEPLETKRQTLADTEELLQQDEKVIAEKRGKLARIHAELGELSDRTNTLLKQTGAF